MWQKFGIVINQKTKTKKKSYVLIFLRSLVFFIILYTQKKKLEQEQQSKNMFITTTNNNLYSLVKRLNSSSTKANKKPRTIPFRFLVLWLISYLSFGDKQLWNEEIENSISCDWIYTIGIVFGNSDGSCSLIRFNVAFEALSLKNIDKLGCNKLLRSREQIVFFCC
jgi:hypothetical protein